MQVYGVGERGLEWRHRSGSSSLIRVDHAACNADLVVLAGGGFKPKEGTRTPPEHNCYLPLCSIMAIGNLAHVHRSHQSHQSHHQADRRVEQADECLGGDAFGCMRLVQSRHEEAKKQSWLNPFGLFNLQLRLLLPRTNLIVLLVCDPQSLHVCHCQCARMQNSERLPPTFFFFQFALVLNIPSRAICC
jgi:hypothetical protein